MEQITSRENPRVKRVLRLLADKAEREESGLFVAEGARLCLDAAMSGILPLEFFMTARALEKYTGLNGLLEKSREAYLISDSVAAKLSDTKSAQGVFAVCEKRPHQRPKTHPATARYLLLASLQDPGNVGAIIRSAEAFGLDGVAVSGDCPELYGPKTLRAAMGGVFRLNIWIAADMLFEIRQLREEGVTVCAAALDASAKKLGAMKFDGGCAVLLGNEGAGLSRELVRACDFTATIPMRGRADSLGVAAAAGIFAWEMTKGE